MPILAEKGRGWSEVAEMLDDPKRRHLVRQEDREAAEKFARKMATLKESLIGNSQLDVVKAAMISARDVQNALAEAMRPSMEIHQKFLEAFKPHESQLLKIAEIANQAVTHILPKLPDLKGIAGLVEMRDSALNEHRAAMKENFKAMTASITESTWPTIVSEKMFVPEITRERHLTEAEKEDIAERAAQKMMEKMEEKLLLEVKQATIPIAFPLKAEEIPHSVPKKKVLRWGHLVIDYQQATLRYKNKKTIEITPDSQIVKWLTCVIEKNGEVAEYVEVALAIEHISEKQQKENDDVGRYVQLVKKRVVSLLQRAGMTKKEIDQMLITKRGFGFAMRKLEAAQRPQK